MKTILAFIDFSDVTDAVVETSADLARAFKSKLFLVHVATPESDYEGDTMRADISREGVSDEMRDYHHKLQKLESNYRDAGIDTTSLLVRSNSARQASPEDPPGNRQGETRFDRCGLSRARTHP